MRQNQKPMAIMFADISGSTQLYDRLGDETAKAMVDRCLGHLQIVTEAHPSDQLRADLAFAWAACRHVKSNAIVLAQDGALVGVGAGQMSRVNSVRLAVQQAGDRARGAVMASDAFFPFRDGVDVAAEAGVTAVMQPGGSRRDGEVIEACDAREMAMLFTGVRHFRH